MTVLGVNFDMACFMAYCKTSCTLALVALPVFTGIPIIGKKKRWVSLQNNKFCIPIGSLRDILMREAHSGALGGHFRFNKTIGILRKHFYCSKMASDVHNVVYKSLRVIEPRALFTNDYTLLSITV